MTLDQAIAGITRAYLRTLLVAEGGSMTKVAKRAGRDRTNLYVTMRKHGLDPKDFKAPKE